MRSAGEGQVGVSRALGSRTSGCAQIFAKEALAYISYGQAKSDRPLFLAISSNRKNEHISLERGQNW